jgi:hypothetical protein
MKAFAFFGAMFFFATAFLGAQSVAVEDFTATQEDIRPLMSGATDVLRSALSANSVIQLTANRRNAQYVITGSVTRFGAVRPASETSGSFSGSVNIAVQLFSFISVAGQTGHIASQNRSGNAAAAEDAEANPRVVVSAQMTEISTGRIVASGTVQAVTWEEYLEKSSALAASFIERLPFPTDIFAGTWETIIDHGGYEDSYRLTFRSGNRCAVELTSIDNWGRTQRQSAEGSYTYASDILSINVRFREYPVAHVRLIDWRLMITLAPDRRSFNAVIPVSNASGADRVRAVFWKE